MTEQYDNSDDRGALWARKTKAGDTYFTGEVNGERVVAWLNRNATPENKQPTYRIKLDKPICALDGIFEFLLLVLHGYQVGPGPAETGRNLNCLPQQHFRIGVPLLPNAETSP